MRVEYPIFNKQTGDGSEMVIKVYSEGNLLGTMLSEQGEQRLTKPMRNASE